MGAVEKLSFLQGTWGGLSSKVNILLLLSLECQPRLLGTLEMSLRSDCVPGDPEELLRVGPLAVGSGVPDGHQ